MYVAQSKTSYESGLQTSSFKHGYEDSNVLQHNTAGYILIFSAVYYHGCTKISKPLLKSNCL